MDFPGEKAPARAGRDLSAPGVWAHRGAAAPRGSAQTQPFIPALAHTPGGLRGEGTFQPHLPSCFGTEMLLSRPWGQVCWAPLALPAQLSPALNPAAGLPSSVTVTGVMCSCHIGLSRADSGDITGPGDTFTGPGSGEIPSLALGLPKSRNGSFSSLPLCAGLPPAAHPAASQTYLTHLTFYNHHVFFQNKAWG